MTVETGIDTSIETVYFVTLGYGQGCFPLYPTTCLLYRTVSIRVLTPVSVALHPLADPHSLRSTEVLKSSMLRVWMKDKGLEESANEAGMLGTWWAA